jgi:hypothetical protein
VHSAIRAASPAEIRRRMAAPDFQPRRETLLLSDPPGLESCPEGGEMVRMRTTANPNRIRIDATMSCRGMVILSETAFPGWRATIDGHPSPIWEPFGALRGIVVEKGSYRPVSAMAGGGMSLAGALLVFGIWFRTRKPASR